MSQAPSHMDYLKGWIGPRVHQALTEVLDWKTQGSPATNDGQEVKFEDDGNSLRVRSSKKEYVQISKIEEFSRPVQLGFSDTETFLKVIVSAAAAERFENSYGRRVTEGTLGAVIQVHDYEIVAQHHGPKRTKITMLIHHFIHIGSDGSPPFGTPCSIECQPPIIELLEKLQTLRAQEQPSSQSHASVKAARDYGGSPSQATSMSSADDGHDRSQAIFATQIPRLQSKKRLREGSIKSNETQPSALDESDSARSLEIVKAGDGSDRTPDAESPLGHGAKELSPSHDRQASLKPMDIQRNVDGQIGSEKRVPEQEEPEQLPRNKFEDSISKRTANLLSLLERNKAKPELPLPILKASELAKQDPPEPVTSALSASKDASPDPSSDRRLSPTRVTKPAQRSSPLRVLNKPNTSKPARPSRKVGALISLSAIPANRIQLPSRITGRDIRISKSQKDLLDRADSWYPPEPGHRRPSANVPISVLQDLNRQAERQATSLRESLQVSSQSESSEAEENDQSFESEEPFPTEEWPASPEAQVVLPPDSSLSSVGSLKNNLIEQSPEPENDHDLKITTSIEEGYLSPKSRPSTNSLSSHSDMELRRSLPRAAKTNSSRPSHHSSKASTPRKHQSPALPRTTTKINTSPPKILPGLAHQQTGHNHPHDMTDQPRLHSQDSSINHINVKDKSDLDQVSEEPKYFRLGILDNAHLLPSIPRSREAGFQNRGITSSSSSTRDSSPLFLDSEPLNPTQISQKAHQSPTKEPSEFLNSSSSRIGKLQSKPRDTGSSESESDIETSIPYGFHETNDVPSTIPFTQVSRTPYLSMDSAQAPLSSMSPTGANNGLFHLRTNGARKPQLSKAASDVDRANGTLNTYGADNHQELRDSESIGHTGHSKPRADQGSFVGQTDSSATDQPVSMIEETVLPPETFPGASEMTKSILLPKIGVNSNSDQKRKASEPVLSPNVTKRRKAHKVDRVLPDLGTTGPNVDPDDIGRQLRHEFFAHRKSLTAHSNHDGKDAAEILDGSKSASTGSPQIISDILPEKPVGSATREDPNPPDDTTEKPSSEEIYTALTTQPVISAPPLDIQAQDIPIEIQTDNLDHNDSKKSDVGSVHQAEIASNVLPSVEVSARASLPKTPDSVFDRFMMTYPDYPGNSVHFAAICSRICTLFQEDRMEHPSLWDDFIVRHRTEYPKYMGQCADEAVDPMPFERYYRTKILQAKYMSANGPIVTPINIRDFQPCVPKYSTSTTSESIIGKLPKRHTPTTSESSIAKLPEHNTFMTRESSIGKLPPTATSKTKEKERKSIEIIELSDREDFFKPTEKVKSVASSTSKQVRRSLPWKSSDEVPNGESPSVKQTVSTPVARVAEQRSSAKTTIFKYPRSQNITPSSPSARIEKMSNLSSQSRPRNGATSTTPLTTLYPPPKVSTSKVKLLQRSNETNLANDPHSPYNTWARDYQSITPGKGNSYAQGSASQKAKPKDKRKTPPIDPFMFEL